MCVWQRKSSVVVNKQVCRVTGVVRSSREAGREYPYVTREVGMKDE